jgi:hypothetical protein
MEDPAAQLRYANNSLIARVPQPASIVLYFYEGNDIDENYQEVKDRLLPQGFDKSRLHDYDYFIDFVRKHIVEKNPVYVGAGSVWVADGERLFRFIKTAVNFVFLHEGLSGKFKGIDNQGEPAGVTNKVFLSGKVVPVPDGFQGPSMLLDDVQTGEGFVVLEQSVHAVRDVFPGVPVSMVYIPSPSSIYKFASTDIDLWDMINNPDERPHRLAATIRPRSNMFCQRVMRIAKDHAVYFHDARPVLLEHGSREFLHGPVDWHHFNVQGYRVLAGEVQKAVTAMEQGTDAGLSACQAI